MEGDDGGDIANGRRQCSIPSMVSNRTKGWRGIPGTMPAMRRDAEIRGSARIGLVGTAFGLAAVVILVVFVVLLPRYTINSGSMEKTLKSGDHVLVRSEERR